MDTQPVQRNKNASIVLEQKGNKMSDQIKKYVAYTRVSTKEQGLSGLGLGSQLEAIKNAIDSLGGILEAHFSEVASGTDSRRPQLSGAIELCKEKGYILIIAKLDRLGRKARYLLQIRDELHPTKQLYIVEKPDIGEFEFGMYANIADWEAKEISKRTKAALQERERITGKRNGQKKGYNMEKARLAAIEKKAKEARKVDTNLVAKGIIEHNKGLSLDKIATILNDCSLRTVKGNPFSKGTVKTIIKMYGIERTNLRDNTKKGAK